MIFFSVMSGKDASLRAIWDITAVFIRRTVPMFWHRFTSTSNTSPSVIRSSLDFVPGAAATSDFAVKHRCLTDTDCLLVDIVVVIEVVVVAIVALGFKLLGDFERIAHVVVACRPLIADHVFRTADFGGIVLFQHIQELLGDKVEFFLVSGFLLGNKLVSWLYML